MKDNSIAISDAQKRGRLFLIAALGIIAAYIIQGLLRGVSQGETNLQGGIMGNGMLLLILVLAFRRRGGVSPCIRAKSPHLESRSALP